MDLYSYVSPRGVNTPISVEPFPVDESVPTYDYIELAVKQLQNNRSGGDFWDAGQAPERVTSGGEEEGEGEGGSGGGDDGEQQGGGSRKSTESTEASN